MSEDILRARIVELEAEVKKWRYYGSDLNEFIHDNCTRKMTSINIDLFQLRFSKKCLRIIESKHINESMNKGQWQAIKFLANIFRKIFLPEWKIGLFIVRGDKPYNNLSIFNLVTGENFEIIGRDNVIKWLEMEDDICTKNQ